MPRTRIKICGLTTAQDAVAAVAAGADAVGVVLAPSKRRVTLAQAADVLAEVPPLVARVGVFVNAQRREVCDAVAQLGLCAVQFHGDEPPRACADLPVPVIKAFASGSAFDPSCAEAYRGVASAVLVDASVPDARGGTGVTFEWQAVADRVPGWAPMMLAGGLCAANVGEAIRLFRPFAVDVSSGVESWPGVKDPGLMDEFCAAVRAADMEVYDG